MFELFVKYVQAELSCSYDDAEEIALSLMDVVDDMIHDYYERLHEDEEDEDDEDN